MAASAAPPADQPVLHAREEVTAKPRLWAAAGRALEARQVRGHGQLWLSALLDMPPGAA